MSHVVQIKTQVRDAAAVRAGCVRLGLDEPVEGEVKLFSDYRVLTIHLRMASFSLFAIKCWSGCQLNWMSTESLKSPKFASRSTNSGWIILPTLPLRKLADTTKRYLVFLAALNNTQ